MSKPAIDTLSSLRTRVIPKTFDFGGLTLSLEKAAAKARSESNGGRERRQFEPAKRSQLLDRLASRPPGSIVPLPLPPTNRRPPRDYSPPIRSRASESDKIETRRSRLNLPNPNRERPDAGSASSTRTLLSERINPRPVSEFTKAVSPLDRLAAQAASAGSSSMPASLRPRKTYKDRVSSRGPAEQSTRFALERKPNSKGPQKRTGAAGGSGPGGRERRQTRAQEAESTRKAAVLARQNAERPKPVPYSFDGIDASQLSPVLERLHKTGSSAVYREFKHLEQDDRDAAKLVAGNRSIVQKQTVLSKIGAWIPPAQTPPSQDLKA